MSETRKNNKFKDSRGHTRTQSLFFEYPDYGLGHLYTLKKADHKGYPSLYRLYLEMMDLEEFEFASRYLDGMAHWNKLKKAPFFKELYGEMRADLEQKIKSLALNVILADAQDEESKTSTSSAKYLYEQLNKAHPVKKNTKATAAEKRNATTKKDAIDGIADDIKRLGLANRAN